MILACFHIPGTFPLLGEALKRSQSENNNGWANSLRILLLIALGPAVLPGHLSGKIRRP